MSILSSDEADQHLPIDLPLTWSQKVLARERRGRHEQQRERHLIRNRYKHRSDPPSGRTDMGERLSDEEMEVIKVSMEARTRIERERAKSISDSMNDRRPGEGGLSPSKPTKEKRDLAQLDKENLPTALSMPTLFTPSTLNSKLDPTSSGLSSTAPKKPTGSLGFATYNKRKIVGRESNDPFFQPGRYETLSKTTGFGVSPNEPISKGTKGNASKPTTSSGPIPTPTHPTFAHAPTIPPSSHTTTTFTTIIPPPTSHQLPHPIPPAQLPSSPPPASTQPLQIIDLTQTPLAKRKKKLGGMGFTPIKINRMTEYGSQNGMGGSGGVEGSGTNEIGNGGRTMPRLGEGKASPTLSSTTHRMNNPDHNHLSREPSLLYPPFGSPSTQVDRVIDAETTYHGGGDEDEVAQLCSTAKRTSTPEDIVSGMAGLMSAVNLSATLDRLNGLGGDMSADEEAEEGWRTPITSPTKLVMDSGLGQESSSPLGDGGIDDAGSVREEQEGEIALELDEERFYDVDRADLSGDLVLEEAPEEITLSLHDGLSSRLPTIPETYCDPIQEEETAVAAAERSFDSVPSIRAVRRPVKRVLYTSDEDEDQDDERPVDAGTSSVITNSPVAPLNTAGTSSASAEAIAISSGEESDAPIRKPRKFKPPPVQHRRNPFIDDEADGSDDADEVGFDSEGSMADFIVDDGDENDDESGDQEDVLRFSPGDGRTARRAVGGMNTISLDESSDEEDALRNGLEVPKRGPPLRTSSTTFSIHSDAESDASDPDSWLKAPKRNRAEKREWNMEKVKIAQKLCEELDNKVFENKLKELGGKDGVDLRWSVHLRTTAGRANHRRSRNADGSYQTTTYIELSEKVLDTKQKVLNTVAHELCHLACYLISREMKNPHGSIFKSWARKIMKVRPDIKITTKHSYVIEYKHKWQCTNASCGVIFQRQSKSIDIAKQVCGKCESKLAVVDKPSASGATGAMTPRKPSAWEDYLKTHLKVTKAGMPGSTHKEVMAKLGESYRAAGRSGSIPPSPAPQVRSETRVAGRSLLSMAMDLTLSD